MSVAYLAISLFFFSSVDWLFVKGAFNSCLIFVVSGNSQLGKTWWNYFRILNFVFLLTRIIIQFPLIPLDTPELDIVSGTYWLSIRLLHWIVLSLLFVTYFVDVVGIEKVILNGLVASNIVFDMLILMLLYFQYLVWFMIACFVAYD